MRPLTLLRHTAASLLMRELGLEGVVAKYTGAPYQGGRTSVWQGPLFCGVWILDGRVVGVCSQCAYD